MSKAMEIVDKIIAIATAAKPYAEKVEAGTKSAIKDLCASLQEIKVTSQDGRKTMYAERKKMSK